MTERQSKAQQLLRVSVCTLAIFNPQIRSPGCNTACHPRWCSIPACTAPAESARPSRQASSHSIEKLVNSISQWGQFAALTALRNAVSISAHVTLIDCFRFSSLSAFCMFSGS